MIIEAMVKPNSRKFEAKWVDGKLKVALTQPAEKNKANQELVRSLSKLFACPVRLVGGAKSKRKRPDLELCEAEFYVRVREL